MTSGSVPLGEAEEDRPGPHRAAVTVALEQALSLERGDEPGGRALGQLGGLGELADPEWPGALDHAHEQLRARSTAWLPAITHIMEHQFHLAQVSRL